MTDRRPPVVLLFAITVTGITVNSLVTPVIPEILRGLDAPTGLAGPLVAAGTAPGILLAPIIGILADRYGRREVLVPCLVLFAVAGGLGTLAPNIWALIGLRLFQGVGSAGLINLVVVIIGDHWDGNDRARLIGHNAAVLTIAISVLPAVGGGLTDLWDWRGPFAIYPLGLATAVMAHRYLPSTPTRDDTTVREQIAEAMPFLRTRTVLRTLGSGVLLFMLIFGLLLTVLPIYLEDGFGVGASLRGVILGLPAAASTIAALSLGRLQARFGRRRLLIVAGTLFVIGLATIAGSPLLIPVVVALAIFGLGEGLMIPTLQDVATSSAPASSRGAVVAVWVGSARLGQTVGPLIAGVGLTAFGAPWTFAAGAVVALSMVGLLTPRPREAPTY